MRGGVNFEMTSSCVEGRHPRPAGEGNSTEVMEPQSPAAAWHSATPKLETMELERNDSGINSGSSDLQSLSPSRSEMSPEINPPYPSPPSSSEPSEQPPNGTAAAASYYATPIVPKNEMSYHNAMYNANRLTPPGYSAMVPKSESQAPDAVIKAEATVNPQDLPSTSCSSVENLAEMMAINTLAPNNDSLGMLQQFMDQGISLPSTSQSPGHSEEDLKSDTDNSNDKKGPKGSGRVKQFKCKFCTIISTSKEMFWAHSRTHIKPEKQLECKQCTFVTEFKHHMEYHLRNHLKSKPYKCTQCNYACVNKSMLNSHLKSHSNVYQYRCADCNYATKYCHSLKLHLRKNGHKPDVVLNPDGSPNPLPIIDVYGSRRGPKLKSQTRRPQEDQRPSPMPEPYLSQQLRFQQLIEGGVPQFPQLPQLQYQLLGQLNTRMLETIAWQQQQRLQQQQLQQHHLQWQQQLEGESQSTSAQVDEAVDENSGALDLSKPGCSTSRNRRKGRAFRHVPAVYTDSSSDEDDAATTTMFSNVEVVHAPTEGVKNVEEEQVMDDNNNENEQRDDQDEDVYTCKYCLIKFVEPAMYTMHMGYHGYENPFRCNLCGEEYKDKMTFYAHVGRKSHT